MTVSIFSAEETDKINLALQVVVAAVMKILDSHVKNISNIKDGEAKKQNAVQTELLTDFLAGLTTEN